MAGSAAQASKALAAYLEPEFDVEEHVSDLIASHQSFPALRNEVSRSKRQGIARLQALVHSNNRVFLQSSRAMNTALADIASLRTAINTTKRAVASLCAVSFASTSATASAASVAPADHTGRGSGASHSSVSTVGSSTEKPKAASAGGGALADRLSRSTTLDALSFFSADGPGGSSTGGSGAAAARRGAGKQPGSTGGHAAGSAAIDASSGDHVRGATEADMQLRAVSDHVATSLAARKYDAAVDRVIAASSTTAAKHNIEVSVLLLENRVARAIDAELRALPPTAFQLHRPLILLLLDLGRVHDASDAFLRGQAAWIAEAQREVVNAGGSDWALCTNLAEVTVAMVAHAVDAHREIFRGAELSHLALWAQRVMRDLADGQLAPTLKAAFTSASGGGTVIAQATDQLRARRELPMHRAVELASHCAGIAGRLADCGIGACGSTVGNALIPALIALAEQHVASAEHAMALEGRSCPAALVYELTSKVADMPGFRRDAVDMSEGSPFHGSSAALKLWNDVLRATPLRLHGREYVDGVESFFTTTLPSLFGVEAPTSPRADEDAGQRNPAATQSSSSPAPETRRSSSAAGNRFRAAASAVGRMAVASSKLASSSSRDGAAGAAAASHAPSTLPPQAKLMDTMMHSLWMGDGTMRLVTHILALLPHAATDRRTSGGSGEGDERAPMDVSGSASSMSAEERAAAESVRGSPLLIDVIDAALQQLGRAHVFDVRSARDAIRAAHLAGLASRVVQSTNGTASVRSDQLQPAAPPGEHSTVTLSASTDAPAGASMEVPADGPILSENDEEADDDEEENSFFSPEEFVPGVEVRVLANAVAAAVTIAAAAWAHTLHFNAAASHYTAELAEKASQFVAARLVQPLLTSPSPLSIRNGTPQEMDRYDEQSASAEDRLKSWVLAAYHSHATLSPDGTASMLPLRRRPGRIFDFYFDTVSSASVRDFSALLPFALSVLLKVRQLAFAHVGRYGGPATAVVVARELITVLLEHVLCVEAFWHDNLPQLDEGSSTEQTVAREQIALFFGFLLYGAEPVLRNVVLADPRQPFSPNIDVPQKLAHTAQEFIEGLGCKTLSVEVAMRQAATSFATLSYDFDDNVDEDGNVLTITVQAASPDAPWVGEESAVSLASIRDTIHRALGALAIES